MRGKGEGQDQASREGEEAEEERHDGLPLDRERTGGA